LGYDLRCVQSYYLPVCSELGIRLDGNARVVEAKIIER
jgi:hypothetical protein